MANTRVSSVYQTLALTKIRPTNYYTIRNKLLLRTLERTINSWLRKSWKTICHRWRSILDEKCFHAIHEMRRKYNTPRARASVLLFIILEGVSWHMHRCKHTRFISSAKLFAKCLQCTLAWVYMTHEHDQGRSSQERVYVALYSSRSPARVAAAHARRRDSRNCWFCVN